MLIYPQDLIGIYFFPQGDVEQELLLSKGVPNGANEITPSVLFSGAVTFVISITRASFVSFNLARGFAEPSASVNHAPI